MRLEASSDRSLSHGEPSVGGHSDYRHIATVLCAERTNISQMLKAIPVRQSDIAQNKRRYGHPCLGFVPVMRGGVFSCRHLAPKSRPYLLLGVPRLSAPLPPCLLSIR